MGERKQGVQAKRIHWLAAAVLTVALGSPVCSADEKAKLTGERERESYSLGYQFGDYLKKKEILIDLEVYASGIRDSLDGKDPLLDQEEIRETVTGLQKRVMALRKKDFKEKAEKNLLAGNVFLEENGKKEGVKVLPNGLQYKVLKEGSGKTPRTTDTVTVHYRGALIDGTEIDSSFKKEKPLTVKLNHIIRGWSEALQLMQEGSKWQLFIPPDLAYGEKGQYPRIPGNSTLIYEIELISINSSG